MPRLILFEYESVRQTVFEYDLFYLPGIHDDAVDDTLHECLDDGGINRSGKPLVRHIVSIREFLSDDELGCPADKFFVRYRLVPFVRI